MKEVHDVAETKKKNSEKVERLVPINLLRFPSSPNFPCTSFSPLFNPSYRGLHSFSSPRCL